jgi:hypothetical protein
MDTSFPDASGRSQADALASVAAADSNARASSAAGQSALRVKVDGMWNPAGRLSRRSSRCV